MANSHRIHHHDETFTLAFETAVCEDQISLSSLRKKKKLKPIGKKNKASG